MSVLILTSVSGKIADLAKITVPNKSEYCLRHGYSLLVENKSSADASRNLCRFLSYLEQFDVLWWADADVIFTNMNMSLNDIPLGPHVTACEENIVDWNYLNCGNFICRNTPETAQLLREIDRLEPVWQQMPCIWQTLMGQVARQDNELITVLPTRTFNSVAWTHPGGGPTYSPGSHWQPGDFVYHPCGVFPWEAKIAHVQAHLSQVVR